MLVHGDGSETPMVYFAKEDLDVATRAIRPSAHRTRFPETSPADPHTKGARNQP